MKKGTITKYFAGGNTIRGFQSLFHYIPDDETKRFIIIKGGPGTGKSTLMKQIGQQAQESGFATEWFYCSSDNESLDGLSIPSLGFAIVDGTAPHVIDPVIPGAYDEILNLGDCWDAGKLRPCKEEIAALIRENGNWFKQAYHYLGEAAAVMDKLRWLMAEAMDYHAVSEMTHRLLKELVAALPPSAGTRGERHLFAGAITPLGPVNFYPSIFADVERFYLLTGDPGTGKSYLLEQIRQTVSRAGHRTGVYRCGFDAKRLDAVVVPVLKTAFVKVTYPHTFSLPPAQVIKEQSTIALSRFSKAAALKASAGERAENQERLWYLLGKAVEMIRSSKRNHDRLEDYYIRAMDFERIGVLREKLANEILDPKKVKSYTF